MQLTSVLIDQGIINSRHLTLLKQQQNVNDMDEASAILKYLKLPEQVVINALSECDQGRVYYPISTMQQSHDLDDLNRRLLEKCNSVVVEKSGSNVKVAHIKNEELARQQARKVLSSYLVEDVNVIPYMLERKLIELNKRFNFKPREQYDASIAPSSLLDLIICDAISADASDIHIDVVWDQDLSIYVGVVSFRITPDLHRWTKQLLTMEEVTQLKQAVYTRAGRNSADGNENKGHTFNSDLNISGYDFRFSLMPYDVRQSFSVVEETNRSLGYKITMRIQDMNKTLMPIEKLNLGEKPVALLHEISDVSKGILFVTGATGSGKNTTYAGLVNSMQSKRHMEIFEFGDPIEYRLPIIQVPVTDYQDMKDRIAATKTHDPDAIIVTEFRDVEMGHLIKDSVISDIFVITTMHIMRVWDFIEKCREYFGQEDSKTILNYTAGVCHQVMFRELCPYCSVELPVNKMSTREILAYKSLALDGFPVKVANPAPSENGECTCKRGFLTSRLPAAEVLFFNHRDPESMKLLQKLMAMDTVPPMVKEIKEFMHSRQLLLEYVIRDRLIDGKIDFRKAVAAHVTEEVRLNANP